MNSTYRQKGSQIWLGTRLLATMNTHAFSSDTAEVEQAAALVTAANAHPELLDLVGQLASIVRVQNGNRDEAINTLLARAVAVTPKKESGQKAGYTKFGLSLDRLREQAAADMGLSRKDVDDAVISLFQAGYISYPYSRSTCVPRRGMAGIPEVMRTISKLAPELDLPSEDNIPYVGAFFVENFQDAHHAIIPQGKLLDRMTELREVDLFAEQIYSLIAQAYLKAICEPAN